MRIEGIKTKDLHKFACQIYSKAKKDDIIPIAKHRALAYTNNPCADEDDIGLLVAYIKDRCIGYLGIMPVLLRRGGSFSKVYWLSTWFVPAEFRNTNAAVLLIMKALSLKHDVVINAPSPSAERIHRELGLREIGPLNYYMIAVDRMDFLNLTSRLLRRIWKKIGIKSGKFDNMINLSTHIYAPIKKIFYNMLLNYQKRYIKDDVKYKEVSEVREDDIKQARYDLTSTEFYRGIDAVNWMLRYKCVLESDKAEPLDYNYYFSEIRNFFKYIVLKVYSSDGKNYKGFLILSVSSKNLRIVLKVLDFRFSNKVDYKYILFLALKQARIYLADHIEFPDSLNTYVKDDILAKLLLRKKKRIYFCHPKDRNSPLATSLDNIDLNYCDGDLALT